jgi:hypothetical protein
MAEQAAIAVHGVVQGLGELRHEADVGRQKCAYWVTPSLRKGDEWG